jgi:hypothetical protein
MIFPAGSTFVFGSWICVADGDGRLQSQLMEILPPQHTFVAPAIMTDQLIEKLSQLLISNLTQISKVPKEIDSARLRQKRSTRSLIQVPHPKCRVLIY